MRERTVAIMGGTFDPIHNAHLLVAEEARVALGIDEVIFVPNSVPPLPKGRVVSSPAQRGEMVALAIASNACFSMSRLEIERSGPSYSFDTICALRDQRPEIGELFFITGADALLSIRQWHRYRELLAACRFIAVTRPGFDLESVTRSVPEELFGQVQFLAIPGLEISSTDIRNRIAEGRSIRYLTPDSVADYIHTNRLYTASQSEATRV